MFSLQTITSTADQIKTQLQETSSRYVDTAALQTKVTDTRDTLRAKLIAYAVLVIVFFYTQALKAWTKLTALPQAAKVEEVYTAKAQPHVAKVQTKVESLLTTYEVQAKAAKVDELYLMSTVAAIATGVQEAVSPKVTIQETIQETIETIQQE